MIQTIGKNPTKRQNKEKTKKFQTQKTITDTKGLQRDRWVKVDTPPPPPKKNTHTQKSVKWGQKDAKKHPKGSTSLQKHAQTQKVLKITQRIQINYKNMKNIN